MGVEASDQTLVVRRIVSTKSKGKVYLNGSLSPLSALRNIVAPLITLTGRQTPLIEMTGQHDNRNLQSKPYNLEVLDQYSGAWLQRLEFEKQYLRWREMQQEIVKLEEAARSREQRLDFLRFQRDEIESLGLIAGEEGDLETKVSRMRNSTRLIEYVSQSVESLYSGDQAVMAALHTVLQRGAELSSVAPELAKKLEPMMQAKTLLEDSVFEMREYGRKLQADPEEMNRLEERLSGLRKLQKKFGESVEGILTAHASMITEIDSLERFDETLKHLNDEIVRQERTLQKLAQGLHERRRNGASLLEKGVNDELNDLYMKGVVFSLSLAFQKE